MPRLLSRAQRVQDAGRRASFCQTAPENARMFALAALWEQELLPTVG